LKQVLNEVKDTLFELEHFDRLAPSLERLLKGGLDVVLLDLSLPDARGFEGLVRIHAEAPSVPVIILTGLDDETFALEAVRKGAQDYLVKGQFDSKIISRVMNYAVGRKRLETETKSALPRAGLKTAQPSAQLTENLKHAGLFKLLEQAIHKSASDIFLSIGEPPVLRIYGSLKRLNEPPVTEESLSKMIDSLLPDSKRWQYLEGREVDFSIDVEKLSRFRVNIFREHRGYAVTFRPIPRRIPTFEELGLPAVMRELTNLTKGLILLTGPTGNGKTTSMASFIEMINQNHERHIITLEDPIEYIIPHKRSLVHQREIELHTRSFAEGLRGAFRENPDVIMIGELRDLESISLAVRVAETGHLVLGTLHSGNATQSITRILDVFEEGLKGQVQKQLSMSLAAVVSQKLLKKQDGLGMVLATEVLVATPAIRNVIRSGQLQQIKMYIETGKKEGMHTLQQCVKELIQKGLVSSEALSQIDSTEDSF